MVPTTPAFCSSIPMVILTTRLRMGRRVRSIATSTATWMRARTTWGSCWRNVDSLRSPCKVFPLMWIVACLGWNTGWYALNDGTRCKEDRTIGRNAHLAFPIPPRIHITECLSMWIGSISKCLFWKGARIPHFIGRTSRIVQSVTL